MRRIAEAFALILLLLVAGFLSSQVALAYSEPDWGEGAPVPEGGNPNPYQLALETLQTSIRNGKLHAQVYPVEVTGLLPPYQPFENVIEHPLDNPLSNLLHVIFDGVSGFHTIDQALEWIGLHPYPSPTDTGVYSMPYPNGTRPTYRVGFGKIATADGTGFTLSCAACHSSRLFGKTVLGMTNRFPRANETFLLAKKGVPLVEPRTLSQFAGANEGEIRMYEKVREHITSVGAKMPQTLGLDTSLAQVALSLARRDTDAFATPSEKAASHPRPERLEKFVADSKPAVWWDLKYKDRWLSDGSVVSGNPIFTNIIWNEIGRGADLHDLEKWLDRNPDVIRDLTTAVFSIEAPRFTDFFPAERLDLARAKRGESIFLHACARCHGVYEKAWNQQGAEQLPLVERLKTSHVRYPSHTPVIDVGTDPGRYQGMLSLERGLNPLAISRRNGIVIKTQKGYVPPPLVGIWARWPYFHNNSAPSLCAVLTRHEKRPRTYQALAANDQDRDFDSSCNGYPGHPFTETRLTYDTSKAGMHNTGHDEGIFLKNGAETLTPQDKMDLIIYLQTL